MLISITFAVLDSDLLFLPLIEYYFLLNYKKKNYKKKEKITKKKRKKLQKKAKITKREKKKEKEVREREHLKAVVYLATANLTYYTSGQYHLLQIITGNSLDPSVKCWMP